MATITAPRQTNRIEGVEQSTVSRRSQGNVANGERWASLLGGGALALFGLSRGTLGGLGLAALGAGLLKRGATGQCELYSALGINTAEPNGTQASIPAGHGVKLERSMTIAAAPEAIYRFWRNFENLPRFMKNL